MVPKLCELRAKKGMTPDVALKTLRDTNYFGTMLIVLGMADGLVSGAISSTANTVRPALQLIKTKPGVSSVSGAFLMCLKDHVSVFADCAINLDPDPQQLADIAIQSAETAKAFTSGAVAIGPVLQGLNRPVNDLSRGALVQDIINTIALTAIEAQSNE